MAAWTPDFYSAPRHGPRTPGQSFDRHLRGGMPQGLLEAVGRMWHCGSRSGVGRTWRARSVNPGADPSLSGHRVWPDAASRYDQKATVLCLVTHEICAQTTTNDRVPKLWDRWPFRPPATPPFLLFMNIHSGRHSPNRGVAKKRAYRSADRRLRFWGRVRPGAASRYNGKWTLCP